MCGEDFTEFSSRLHTMVRSTPGGRNLCKVVLLGAMSSGKSTLVWRLIKGLFHPGLSHSFGATFATKTMETNKGAIDLHVWDTMGEEKFRSLVRMYYRDAKAAVICCDVTDSKSFYEIEYWIKELQENEKTCKVYVCATKMDLLEDGTTNRAVPRKDMEMFNGNCFETSSKTGTNVLEMFQQIADDFSSEHGVLVSPSISSTVVELSETTSLTEHSQQKKCCGSHSV